MAAPIDVTAVNAEGVSSFVTEVLGVEEVRALLPPALPPRTVATVTPPASATLGARSRSFLEGAATVARVPPSISRFK